MFWILLVIGVILYFAVWIFTMDVFACDGMFIDFPTHVVCLVWPIFWTMYFAYLILKKPINKIGFYYNKAVEFVAERME